MSSFWYDETYRDQVRYGLKTERTLFKANSDFQLVEVLETSFMGRVLVIDGVFMTSERDEYLYHEMLVHPALVTAPSPKRVLIIGGGDGGTAREVLRHPGVEQVTMVEIDGVVVEACKVHMPTLGNWDDPRLELIIGDGVAYVKDAAPSSFDAVLLDGTDPVGPGKGLFGYEFYRGVKRTLAPGGVFALQSESPILMPELFADIQKALAETFAVAAPYFGPVPLYAAGIWSWTYATDIADRRAPQTIDDTRLAAIESGCRYYCRDIHRAAFAVPNQLRALLPS